MTAPASLTRPNSANAVLHFVDRHLDIGNGPRLAMMGSGESFTYRELAEFACRFGNLFAESGIEPENRVLLILPDRPLTAACFWGLVRIGAVPVPLSGQLGLDEYVYIVADCRPKAVVVSRDQASIVQQVRDALGVELLAWIAEADAFRPGFRLLGPELARCRPRCPVRGMNLDDMAVIQYTSGTTGMPKGVVHSHRGLLAVTEGLGQQLGLTRSDVCFCTSKLSFGYGFGNSVLFPLDVGATSVLLDRPADPYRVGQALARFRPTVLFSVPSIYAGLLRIMEGAVRITLESVRLFVSSGERLIPSLLERWKLATGAPILDCFGATECLHAFMASDPDRSPAGSCGRALEGCQVRLLDDQGEEVPGGTPGYVHVWSPWNGDRYWNHHLETVRTMPAGWVRTGDVMYQDREGFYYFLGRADDVLKVGALKVSPLEIEECLMSHEAVLECAAVNHPTEDGLAFIVAYVRLRPGHSASSALARELRRHVRARLSRHKVPRQIEFVDELPRTTTGKLARARLRPASAGPATSRPAGRVIVGASSDDSLNPTIGERGRRETRGPTEFDG